MEEFRTANSDNITPKPTAIHEIRAHTPCHAYPLHCAIPQYTAPHRIIHAREHTTRHAISGYTHTHTHTHNDTQHTRARARTHTHTHTQ